MNFARSAPFNMHLLISFIGFFAIFSSQSMFGRSVNAEVDVNMMDTSGKISHEHHASLTSDGNFFNTDNYFGVETIPGINGNMSINSRSGKYYDDYLGTIDMYPDGNYYDYDPDSRVAPTEPPTFRTEGRGDTGYTITPSRLKELREHFLYWYFDKGGPENNGDYQRSIHASNPQLHKNFNFQLPFYGFRFNYTRISMHGFLEFSDPPEQYTYPLSFPVKDWPKRNDPSFIGIFFSKCRIGKIYQTDYDQRVPGVYFRQERDLQTRTDRFGVEVRERVMWDIREGVVGADTFIPKHVVIITWKNMSFAGGIDNSLYKTNSFQMVLATDEVYTYAIFNYINLVWSSHTEAGGDTTGGEGGVPAFIGFNAGNGTQAYEYKPYSQASVLRDLTGRGWANGFPGRHIFRIDEKIMLGTCNKDIDAASLPLVFAPESGNMLGGQVVNITGPCFEENERITCTFDTIRVAGHRVDRNRAICVQPFLTAQGYVKFEVSIGTGRFNWKGLYFVETPATATERIFFRGNDVYEKYPEKIQIEWNRFNLTSNLNAGVTISLYGYHEESIKPKLEYIDLLENGITNINGQYDIVTGNYRNRDNRQQSKRMEFGFIKINLTNPDEYAGLKISPVLWSRPIPLGWYFAPQWERAHGKNWPRALCDNWIRTDRFLRPFAAEIPICPCTLEHAVNDKGRFMPDIDCDKDSNPSCTQHEGAYHCVKTGQPNIRGAEQQCCYDRYGYLFMSHDQMWDSRPRRNHNIGVMPWKEANKVPSLSTWYNDIRPFYSCCFWQEEQAIGCETFRFERRPTQDCVAYQSPAVAGVFGDPHVVTFDDREYTFNGKGEFVLVHVNESSGVPLDVQGRFEQIPRNIYGPVNATQLTSVVAKGNSTVRIEVRLRPTHAQWRYRLDVFANDRRIYFDRPSLKFQSFQDVTVYTPTYVLNQSEVVIMFSSGAGVEVVENAGFLTARVYLPWTYINKTRGLLGTWSWDQTDDFVLPDGTPRSVNLNNFESVHKDFAIQWMLADREKHGVGAALFTREFGRTASYYSDDRFIPNYLKEPDQFLPPNRTEDIERAHELCGESYQCRYDYGMSLNRDMAHYTKFYYDKIINIKAINNRRETSCGVLETPRFGRKSTFSFIPGTSVAFECDQGFVLIGDPRRTCTAEGKWDPPVYGYTQCLREVYYTQRSAWIATGVVFASILPILMCIICAVYCYRKKARKVDPGWKLSLPRSRAGSRAGSRTTLRQLTSDGSDSDTLKKTKKWDLDEEDFTSSEGGSEFPQGKIAKEISYIGDDTPQQPERQTGRRNQRAQQQQQLQQTPSQQQQDTIQDESYLTQAAESSPGFSPVHSGYGGAKSRTPSGGIRVLPSSNKFFSDSTGSPVSSGSPVLTQNVGLPSPPLNNRSTQV